VILLWLLLCVALAGPRVIPAEAVDDGEATDLFRGRRLALLVGPEGFDDPSFAPLRYTDDDARALAEVLEDPARGHFDEVWTLTTTEDTRLSEVHEAMAALGAQSRSADDTVFVYFSSHGTLARDARGRLRQYLVLSDTRLADVPETALSHEEVLDWLEGLPSRRKVLLLATCHSGQGKSALPPDMEAEFASTKGPPPIPPLREVSEAVIVIGVCAWNETARESEKLGHDIYTWHFLQALEQGDLDGDGAVTATEAHDRARRLTYDFTGGAQRPYARVEVLGDDPVVLSGQRSRAGAPAVGSFRENYDGYGVRVDGVAKGALPGLIPLDPGPHRVEVLSPGNGRVVARQRVRLRAGGRVDVDTLLRRDILRFGIGGGWQAMSAPDAGGPAMSAELHLPRLLGRGWEVVAQGSTVTRWPRPTLEGGIDLERVLVPGALQLRAGAGLEGFLLQAPGEPALLAPSLVPVPVVSAAYLPTQPVFVRLSVSGGYLWYADGGQWHHGWTLRPALVAGGAF